MIIEVSQHEVLVLTKVVIRAKSECGVPSNQIDKAHAQ
jgi:hypothetical protein